MDANLAAVLYLVSGLLFIYALRGLSSPETSRQGNRAGMVVLLGARGSAATPAQMPISVRGEKRCR